MARLSEAQWAEIFENFDFQSRQKEGFKTTLYPGLLYSTLKERGITRKQLEQGIADGYLRAELLAQPSQMNPKLHPSTQIRAYSFLNQPLVRSQKPIENRPEPLREEENRPEPLGEEENRPEPLGEEENRPEPLRAFSSVWDKVFFTLAGTFLLGSLFYHLFLRS